MKYFQRIFRPNRSRRFIIDKRQRFAIQTAILTTGLLITQLIWEDVRFIMVAILSVISYFLTAWSLTEDVKKHEWFLLFILPVLFTASVSLFYFLLPQRWSIRLATIVIFSVGTYASLLVENIYNVAVERSIQLLRAARSVGLLLTLVVVYLTSNIIYSLHLPYWESSSILILLSFILGLQSLWSVQLGSVISKNLFLYAAVIALGIGELTLSLSFLPVQNASYSLLLTAAYYCGISLLQLRMLERLFRNSIREYATVFLFVLILALLTTGWKT